MSTLVEIITNPIAIILYMYIGLWIWESLAPAKTLPVVPYWKLRGVLFFIFNFLLSTFVPLFVDTYLLKLQIFDFSSVNTWLAAGVAVFVYEGLFYVWHSTLHRSDFLWRSFHQLHHSSERLDVPSAFYTGPLDTIGFTMLGSFSFVLILGIPAPAATIALLFITFFSIFQHANIKTPRWLGYIIQRPESHSLHHGRGVHGFNYSDFPIFDMIFGTFKNPEKHMEETGFYEGGSGKILEMLSMKDISKPSEK